MWPGWRSRRRGWPFARGRAAATFEVTHTDAEWQAMLSPAAYSVLRQEGTEPPFTSALLDEHRKGTFTCAGCDAGRSSRPTTKFDSGTGWPSFWQPLDNAVGTTPTARFGMTRTAVSAAAAAAISATSSTTARSRPACAIA